MKGKYIQQCIVLFVFVFLVSQSSYAAPLCVRKGITIEDVVISTASIGGNYEVCPWYKKKMENERIRRIDHFASILAYMLGDSLKDSKWSKNRELADQYLKYSFQLALKHGITLKEHATTLRSIAVNH